MRPWIWALHPLQSAAVVYVSGRAEPLEAAFGFLGLYLGLRMLRSDGNARWGLGVGAGFSFLTSALSKEMGLIFLLVWLIIALAQGPRRALLGTAGLLETRLTVMTRTVWRPLPGESCKLSSVCS